MNATRLGERLHGDRLVRPGDADHAVNVVAGGPPQWLLESLRGELEQLVARYPDDNDARRELASLHDRRPEEIVLTNGAAEALWLLPAALRPHTAICVQPAFTEGAAALLAHRISVTDVVRNADDGFRLDPDSVPDDADLVVVANPASPDGTLEERATLERLRRPGRVLVVDEAFIELAAEGTAVSLASKPHDDVIVIRSLTKVLAVPGLRVGYAIAPPPLARQLELVRPPWSANAFALAAAVAAAGHPAALAAAAQRARTERDDLVARLESLEDVDVWPGSANFCLIRVDDGERIDAELRRRRIAVRPCGSFTGLDDRYLRLTARAPAENERLVDAIAAILAINP